MIKNSFLSFLFLIISQYGFSQRTSCDDKLWNHVYHKERLNVVNKCMEVTGTVFKINKEKDGDAHILLHLDAGQQSLLNGKNISQQHGALVVEVLYAFSVSQMDALSAGVGFTNYVKMPRRGDHIKVTGSYVLDKKHGWMEIHPVSRIEKL